MVYPADNNVIPDADPGELLSNMHTTLSHTEGTNAIIAKLAAVAAKLGNGASTPGASQVLTTDESNNSLWAKISNALIAADAAIALSKLAAGSAGVLRSDGSAITAGNKVTNADITDDTISLVKLVHGSSGLLKSNGTVISAGNKLANSDIDDGIIALAKLIAGSSGFLKSNGTVVTAGNSVAGADIQSSAIVNAHIAANADIAVSKLADGTARQVLVMNTAADTPTWTSVVPGVTIYVAASDASAAEKSIATYICDGTADESEINSAIGALPSTGGIVKLSSGTFNISSTTIALNKAYSILEGSGYNTRLKFSASYLTFRTMITISQSYTGLKNLLVDGNKTNNVGAAGHLLLSIGSVAYPVVENVLLMESAVYGVFCGSNMYGGNFVNVSVTTCQNLGWSADGCGTTKIPNHYTNCSAISNATEGFSVAGYLNIFTNCVGYGNTTNFAIGDKPGNQFIGCKSYGGTYGFYCVASIRNQFSSCYSYDDTIGYWLSAASANNQVVSCYSYSASSYGFLVDGTNSNANVFQSCFSIGDNYGIAQGGSNTYNSIQGCHVQDSVGHGIHLSGGSHHSILGNTVLNSSVGSSSYNGINVASSDYNTIMNNQVRKGAGTSPYGINIASGSYNLVGPNDLILGGNTAAFNDAGTATRKTVVVAQSSAVSSSSLVEITTNTFSDVTDMSITIVSGGGDIEVELCGLITNNTNGTYAAVGFSLNGADTIDLAAFTPNTASQYGNASCFYRWNNTTLGTSYTIKARMRTQTATTTKAQMYGRSMKVRELRNY